MNTDYIKASELGEYIFCKRVWWLRQNGFLNEITEEMSMGTLRHENMLLELLRLPLRTKLAWVFIWGGIILLTLVVLYLVFL